ncbi:hypothetical protein KHF85_12130 [Xanthomonas translucens pv. graminis]|uniref:hypothetical protein n=1 Tax=Xanthomonas graminis TaxID=3390026 RepID=UPI00253FD2AE|nr:hypothetical protein [Xanthomonas translucens]WIH03644.1 hypothetical protein KHF85_12130 [Xanthomonas translucens pv. graminis]
MLRNLLLVFLFLSSSGCTSPVESSVIDSKQRVSVAADNSSAVKASKKNKDSISIFDNFKKGMSYGDLRKLALTNGWLAKPHSSCKQGVVGAAFEKVCSSNPKRCEACELAPELSECSGDGYCLMEFADADGGKLLAVATYGEIEDVLVTGKDSRLQVTSWEVKSVK